jgi:hypothetical protein
MFHITFRVFNDPCPGCITQLVTGLNFPGSYGEWCAYDGIPGVSPGVSGSEAPRFTPLKPPAPIL